MCKKCIFTLIVLCLVGSVYGASMTIVELPAVGTDAAIGIDAGKTYTHAFDFGTGAPSTINGVALDQGPTANLTALYEGVSSQGYGYTLNDTRSTVNIKVHGGNDPSVYADGASAEMLRDMIYFSGANVNEGIILTLQDLTPGTEYSVRYYYRSWDPDIPRPISISADGGAPVDIDIDEELAAFYLDYTFVADDSDVTIEFITNDDNQGVHLYGLTCEEVSAAAPAMVAHWPMDEGAGTVVADVVGGNDGTIVGNVFWIDGILGGAVTFDNSDPNAAIVIPHAAELDFGDVDFSISMMVRYPTIPGDSEHQLIMKGTFGSPDSGSRYTLFNKNGEFRFEIDNGPANVKSGIRIDNTPVVTGEWVHVVLVRDAVNDLLAMYIDGVLMTSGTDDSGDISSGEEMRIGNTTVGNDRTCEADIDDVRIFNVALTEEDINAIYEPAVPLLVNGSFELPGTKKMYGFNGESHAENVEPLEDIPGWATDTDTEGSGVELGTDNSDAAPDGDWVAFLRGIDSAIWQTTEHVIEADDAIVLSLEAKDLWAEQEPLIMTMTVYYDDNGLRVPIASEDQVLVLGEWHTFTLTSDVSAVPEATGKKLGVEIDIPGNFTWALIDNVVLEVN